MSTFLISQASGQQSRWTIKHLLAAGHKVHAVVRNPDNLHPLLKSPGVTVFKGESTDFDAVYKAAQGCKGVFLNTYPIPGVETEMAKTITEAAKKAGVETVVASTSLVAGDKAVWDDEWAKEVGLHGYFSSKNSVEEVVRAAGFKAWTILRGSFIHSNYYIPSVHGNYPKLPTAGVLDHAFEEGTRMIHTDGNDIGAYAAAALQNPSKFAGEVIELTYENLTIEEVRDILVKVSGRQVRIHKRTPEEVEEAKEKVPFQKFQLWTNQKDLKFVVNAGAEVQAKFGIPFTSLEKSLTRDRELLLECIPA